MDSLLKNLKLLQKELREGFDENWTVFKDA